MSIISRKHGAVLGVAIFSVLMGTPALAQENVFRDDLRMCPDAHGEAQKALFKRIDLTGMPMRVQGLGETTIAGSVAPVSASRAAAGDADPIAEAFMALPTIESQIAKTDPRLVAVCFATQDPPANDEDGPFFFVPGYMVAADTDLSSSPEVGVVTIPPQTYLVLTFQGPAEDIGNMRFTLTDYFWPEVAPEAGLVRADGPNIMIWAPGYVGNEPSVELEMWTPIQPMEVDPFQ